MLPAANVWDDAGCSVVPAAADGSKKPGLERWAIYQRQRADKAQLARWFSGDNARGGLGVVCGAISGNLEMFEFEGRAMDAGIMTAFTEAMDGHGQGELWATLCAGYQESTPSGGIHILYRVDGVPRGNLKLAKRPATEDELNAKPDETVKVLIETRGEGGFTITAPSNGTTHPTGRAWQVVAGSPSGIPVITAEQRDTLFGIASLFDEMPAHAPPAPRPAAVRPTDAPLRPGDDYEQRTDWTDILVPFGWTRMWPIGHGYGWRRPGKDERSISATTGQSSDGVDRLYVFSSSTEFETETPYSKFGAYTQLVHGGDFKAASKALRAGGYGAQEPLGAPALSTPVHDVAGSLRLLGAPPIPAVDAVAAGPEPVTAPPAATGRALILTAASGIVPAPVFWLWEGRLALGTLGLLAGREGVGKSTLAYWMVGAITKGTLPGQYAGADKAVLVCATEDSWSHTIVPRLIAAHADLTKVFRVEVLDDGVHRELSLPRDLVALERAALDNDAALLLLDPLMSRLGDDLDSHKDGEVRQALEPLVAVADKTGMAILGLIHHNKSGSSDPLQLVMGSKAFTAVARSVHTVVTDPDDDSGNRRLFGTPKNNLGRADLPMLGYTITGFSLETPLGIAWTSQLVWGPDATGTLADAMSRAADTSEDRSAVVEAAEWLTDYLAIKGGQAASADVKRAAAAAGHNVRTLTRARSRIGVTVSEGRGKPRATYWELNP